MPLEKFLCVSSVPYVIIALENSGTSWVTFTKLFAKDSFSKDTHWSKIRNCSKKRSYRMFKEAFLVLVLQSLFVLTLEQQSRRASTSELIMSGCQPKRKAMGKRRVPSVLQCQHYCTAEEKCRQFAVGVSKKPGSLFCHIYSLTANGYLCVGRENWASYSFNRQPKVR